jgi:hypothetical protein
VALDEAFAATRPELAALLQEGGGPGIGLFARHGPPIVRPLALGASPGAALDAAVAESKRAGAEAALVASPLVAKALLEGGSWSGKPPILSPEWRGAARPGLSAYATDPVPAYGAAGAAAGAYVAALAGSGGSPSCGILFSEAPARPREALEAFARAYAESSEDMPLRIRELGQEAAAAASAAVADPAASADRDAEAAVAELLGTDLRLVFIAIGEGSGAAIKAAARPGLAIGADAPYPEASPLLAFRVVPNEQGIRAAIDAGLAELRGGGEARSGSVPALLVAESPAGSIKAGQTTLEKLVEGAALRVKGAR